MKEQNKASEIELSNKEIDNLSDGEFKASERELSNKEIANLSDGEFKALVIKMLTELIELGRKNEKANEGYPK